MNKSFKIYLYFLNPFIFDIYTFIIIIISFIISSSVVVSSSLFIISISPSEYSFIISSINSYPNLANLSLYATTTLFIFPSIAKCIIFFYSWLY